MYCYFLFPTRVGPSGITMSRIFTNSFIWYHQPERPLFCWPTYTAGGLAKLGLGINSSSTRGLHLVMNKKCTRNLPIHWVLRAPAMSNKYRWMGSALRTCPSCLPEWDAKHSKDLSVYQQRTATTIKILKKNHKNSAVPTHFAATFLPFCSLLYCSLFSTSPNVRT